MRPQAVRRYRKPRYPTSLEVAADTRLLLEHLPSSWGKHALIRSSLAVFLAASSCQSDSGEQEERPAPPSASVAPIFEHGEGIGSTGCIVVSPPVFLSEEEALVVIREELRRGGLEPAARDVELGQVEVKFDGPYSDWMKKLDLPRKRAAVLRADLCDTRRHVAVEFVSQEDDCNWAAPGRFISTAQSHFTKDTAARLGNAVRRQQFRYHYAAFYDPLEGTSYEDVQRGEDGEWDFEAAHRKAKEDSLRLLRLQVKDFVDWLKGQGVI